MRAEWAELPGWADDNVQRAWPALLRKLDRENPGYAD